MNLSDCYRLLGLRSGASFSEVKASYRRLARRYHPDVNPDNQQAKDKFIQITEAYKVLGTVLQLTEKRDRANQSNVNQTSIKVDVKSGTGDTPSPQTAKPPSSPPRVKVTRKYPSVQFNPSLTEAEQQLKQASYEQLQLLLRTQRFPRAIALVEGLSQRLPQDPEIRQWQAIAYQRWGRHLINEKQLDKARSYLKKALRTDPHNKSLWAEVEKDFKRMERIF